MSTGWQIEDEDSTNGLRVVACRAFDYDTLSVTPGETFEMKGQRNDRRLIENGYVRKIGKKAATLPCPKCKGREFLPGALRMHEHLAHEVVKVDDAAREAQWREDMKRVRAEEKADFAFATANPDEWNELQRQRQECLVARGREPKAPTPVEVKQRARLKRELHELEEENAARQRRIDEELRTRYAL